MPDSKPNLYALLVAIDEYPVGVSSLKGCVNDMNAFRGYLEERKQFDLKLRVLENSGAGREAFLDAFHNHFEQAKDGDVCVFYYSGHGSRISAPDFWQEWDGNNQTLVLHDSRLNGAENDLVDKELSCLIWEVTREKSLHFLAVMDCCHSGGNTRDAVNATVVARQEPGILNARSVTQYYGFDKGYYEQQADGKWNVKSEGSHMKIAASRSDQTAKETDFEGIRRGVFTHGLLEALNTANTTLSYSDLMPRTNARIASKVNDQTAQLESVHIKTSAVFLGGAIKPPSYSISYQQGQWRLNAGTIQGIRVGETSITLRDNGAQVGIAEVKYNYSLIEGMEGAQINKDYEVSINNVGTARITVAFDVRADKYLIGKLKNGYDANRNYSQLLEDQSRATYLIRTVGNACFIAKPGSDRPVFMPIEVPEEGYSHSVDDFWQKIEQVGKWYHVFYLENPNSGFTGDEVSIELEKVEGDITSNAKGEIITDFSKPVVLNAKWWEARKEWIDPYIRINIKNNSEREIWATALLMSGTFEITNSTLNKVKIQPKGSVSLTIGNSKELPYWIEKSYIFHGITQMRDYIKLLVSNSEISTDEFNMEPLNMDISSPRSSDKGYFERAQSRKKAYIDIEDWSTKLLTIDIFYPQTKERVQDGALGGILHQAPVGMSATAAIASFDTISSILSIANRLKTIQMPLLSPLELNTGFHESSGPSVLTLNIQAKVIEGDHTLQITPKSVLEENEWGLTLAFDPETRCYLPAGYSSGSNRQVLELSHIPRGIQPFEAVDKGLGDSLLLFFHKIMAPIPVLNQINKLIGDKKYTQLRQVEVKIQADGKTYETHYIDNPEILKEQVRRANRILLFIHGIIGDTGDSVKIVKEIRSKDGKPLADYYNLVLAFDYESLGTDIEETAGKLKAHLADLALAEGHGKELHVIAHAMGGLVSRHFIEQLDGNKVVTHLIMVGTPNCGTDLYSVYEFANVVLTKAINFIPMSELGKTIAGWVCKALAMDEIDDTFLQMKPDSPFLVRLNAGKSSPGIPYTVLAGNTRLAREVYDAEKKVIQKLGYPSLDILFKKDNDIAVSVESILGIPWLEDSHKHQLGCDHMSYFNSREGQQKLGEILFRLVE